MRSDNENSFDLVVVDDGCRVVWVTSTPTTPDGFGPIVLQSYGAAVAAPAEAGPNTQPALTLYASNENGVWVGDEHGAGSGGAIGREPTIAALEDGGLLVSWIDQSDRVHAKLYLAEDSGPGEQRLGPAATDAINAQLVDLGTAAPLRGESDPKRVRVVSLGESDFAVAWVAAVGGIYAVQGKLFSQHDATTGDDLSGGARWTASDIAPVRLPEGFNGNFWIVKPAAADNGDLVIKYASDVEGRTQIGWHHTDGIDARGWAPVAFVDGQSEHDTGHDRGSFALSVLPAGGSVHSATKAPVSKAPGVEEVATSLAHRLNSPLIDGAFKISGSAGDHLAQQLVVIHDNLIAAVWQTPGATDHVASLFLSLLDPLHPAKAGSTGSIVQITSNAAADVPPVVALGREGAAVAWVEQVWIDDPATGARIAANELSLQFTGLPDASTSHPSVARLVVQVDSGPMAFSDLSIAVQPGHGTPTVEAAAETSGAGPVPDDVITLVWVQDAEPGSGYGDIMMERVAVHTDGPKQSTQPALVPLTTSTPLRDIDAATAGPSHVTVPDNTEPGATASAVGRAPSVAAVNDADIAVVWVTDDARLAGQETIRGIVIDVVHDRQVLAIDLTEFLPTGIAKGSKPTLISTSEGAIIVGWMQSDGQAGYDVDIAVYKATGDGGWLVPDAPIVLLHFDVQPHDYGIVATGNNDLFVTWNGGDSHGDEHIFSQHFDLGGVAIGSQIEVAHDASSQGDAPGTLNAAALFDGHVVVVYASEDGNGDSDIDAVTFDAPAGDATNVRDGVNSEAVASGSAGSSISDGASDPSPPPIEIRDSSRRGSLESTLGPNHNTGHETSTTLLGSTRDQDGDTAPGYSESSANSAGGASGPAAPTDGTITAVLTADSSELIGDDSSNTLAGTDESNSVTGAEGNDTLLGVAGNDLLSGGEGNDILQGGAGDDLLAGGRGDDSFVFKPGFGNDLITDFGETDGNNDVVMLPSIMFEDFAAVYAAMQQVGSSVIITAGAADSITISNVTISSIDADDFRSS